MKNDLYLITGAAGHLGNTIVRLLLKNKQSVRGLLLHGENERSLAGLELERFYGDVRDPNSLRPFFTDPAGRDLIVIHAAGMVSIATKTNQMLLDVNVGGTQNILALCWEYPVKKLVYVSSVHAIPEQAKGILMREVGFFSPELVHGQYAKSKAEATQLVLEAARNGLNASVVHPSGILGRGDYGNAHLTQMVMDYLDGRLRACVAGGYDFVDVRDVAFGTLSCARRGRPGECYILSNQYFTVDRLMDMLQQISGRRAISCVLPLWLARLTAPAAEFYYQSLHQPPLYTPYSLYTLDTNAMFSHEKAAKELSYQTTDLYKTLQDMIAWLEMHHRVKTH